MKYPLVGVAGRTTAGDRRQKQVRCGLKGLVGILITVAFTPSEMKFVSCPAEPRKSFSLSRSERSPVCFDAPTLALDRLNYNPILSRAASDSNTRLIYFGGGGVSRPIYFARGLGRPRPRSIAYHIM